MRKEGLTGDAAADVSVVAKGGAVQIAGQFSQRGLTFLFAAAAVRILSPAGFGLYRQVTQVLIVAGQLGLAGFNYASMRFIARARASGDVDGVRGAARVAFTGAGVASAAAFIVLLALSGVIAAAFTGEEGPRSEAEFAQLLRIGAAYVPLFASMQVLRYCTQAYKTMVPSVVVGNIVQPAARFILGVAALLAGLDVAGAVSTLVASVGAGAGVGVWYYRRMLTLEERLSSPRAEARPMIKFALLQSGASLLGIQTLGVGIIVLGLLDTNRAVGLFAIALALQGPGGIFLSGIVNIWAPVVADLYERGNIDRLESLYQTVTRWVATFSFPVFAALVILPDPFVELFAGSRAADAAPVVALLSLGNFFYTGTGPTGYVISMTGRPGVNFVNSVIAVVLYVVGGYLFVPRYGALGMAGVDAAVTALINSARVVEAKVLVGVQPFGTSFLKPVAATVIGGAVLLAWKIFASDALLLELLGIAVAGAAYVAVLKALGVDAEERYVWDRIRSRIGRRARRSRSVPQ